MSMVITLHIHVCFYKGSWNVVRGASEKLRNAKSTAAAYCIYF
jgi:hypothetical protein